MEIFGISTSALLGQLLLGLVNGSFYAMLSLGLAVIFGLLNVINFAHGALYMMGAFFAWMGLQYFGINYWVMLILAPLLVGVFGIIIEKTMLRWLYRLDHLYGLLLTFGINGGGGTITGPAGWTEVHSIDMNANQKWRVWLKVLDGSEASTVTVTTTDTNRFAAQVLRFTGARDSATEGTGWSASTGTASGYAGGLIGDWNTAGSMRAA
jgi:hypothetical protein